MAEIKVRYRTHDGDHSKAYIDEDSGVGIDKWTAVDVRLAWNGDEWIEEADRG